MLGCARPWWSGSIPVIGELEPGNLRNDQGILQRQTLVGFVDAALEQPGAYHGLVFLVYATVVIVRSGGHAWRGDEVLGRRLSPVLVDAVFELDDGEVADLEGERLVEKDGLACVSLCALFTMSQLHSPEATDRSSSPSPTAAAVWCPSGSGWNLPKLRSAAHGRGCPR
jgi:hypothetical protein